MKLILTVSTSHILPTKINQIQHIISNTKTQ